MYWRTDLEQSDGRHIAIFAESDPTGMIVQQFGLSLDGAMTDPTLTQLVTVADVTGKPIKRIDVEAMGWQKIGPGDYDTAVELKRQLYFRDEHARRNVRSTCAKCGGTGRMVVSKLTCEDCTGTGLVQGASPV